MDANKKDTSLKICCICGQIILNSDYDYSKNRRGGKQYWHKECFRRELKNEN